METFSLYQLNQYIRRVLALNFSESVWVSGEIAQVSCSRGHYFISLIQKEAEEIVAQADAVLWQRAFRRLQRQMPLDLPGLLTAGIAVKLKVQVDFNERYGLKLVVEDLDPAYTLGQLEMTRRQTLEQLRAGNLIGRNAALPLPPVVQRIALLSSEQAAGLQDYQQHLEQNPYGYRFANTLFPVAVQGQNVASEVGRRLRQLRRRTHEFDCVAIIRGGGSRLDLAAFDQYEICETVAKFPLPVLTGIGHDTDETVLDQVAHRALKTPTAVADFLIERALYFESNLTQLGRLAALHLQQKLQQQNRLLDRQTQQWQLAARQSLFTQNHRLDQLAAEAPRRSTERLRAARAALDQQEALVGLLSPEATLRRGYTLTLANGKPVRSAREVQPGDRLLTRLADGLINSTVQNDEKTPDTSETSGG